MPEPNPGLSKSSSRRDPPPPPHAGRARLGDVEVDAEAGRIRAAYLSAYRAAAAAVLGSADADLARRCAFRDGSKEPPPRSNASRAYGAARAPRERGDVDANRENPSSSSSSSPKAPNGDRASLCSAARAVSSYAGRFGVDAASACCGTYLRAFAGGGARISGSASGGSSVSSRRRTASSRGWSDGNPSMPNAAKTRTSSYSSEESSASLRRGEAGVEGGGVLVSVVVEDWAREANARDPRNSVGT
jgi:hypothetical protein